VADIALELTVSESAAKKLLSRMYNKFALFDADRRRGRLAVEALRRGAVSVADLEAGASRDRDRQ
jgi:DNA-binding NarL/FixJ family response regulator